MGVCGYVCCGSIAGSVVVSPSPRIPPLPCGLNAFAEASVAGDVEYTPPAAERQYNYTPYTIVICSLYFMLIRLSCAALQDHLDPPTKVA